MLAHRHLASRRVKRGVSLAPVELVSALDTAGLVTQVDWLRAARRLRRMSEEMRDLDRAWLDALVAVGALSRHQAEEVVAGRAANLVIDSFRIERSWHVADACDVYIARARATRQATRLAVMRVERIHAVAIELELARLRELVSNVDAPCVWPVERHGVDGTRLWAASPYLDAMPISRWSLAHGGVDPERALSIARRTARALALLEEAHLPLDPRMLSMLAMDRNGDAWLTETCLIAANNFGRQPSGSSVEDVTHAWGVAIWSLLAARRPPGYDHLAAEPSRFAPVHEKATIASRIEPIERILPETPCSLTAALAACLAPSATDRPHSFSELVAMIGAGERTSSRAAWLANEWRAALDIARPARLELHGLARRLGRQLKSHMAWATVMLLVVVLAWKGKSTTTFAAREPLVAVAAKSESPINDDGTTASIIATVSPRSELPVVSIVHTAEIERPVFALSAAQSHELARLDLRPGHVVRGNLERRPVVFVPAEGLRVDQDDCVFEGIDFAWDLRSVPSAELGLMTMFHVTAERVTFRDCTFQTPARNASFVAAVKWRKGESLDPSWLPSGEIAFESCVFQGVAACVHATVDGGLATRFSNSLVLGPGPAVRLDRAPAIDEPISIVVSDSTLRGGEGLLWIDRADGLAAGRVAILAENSILALASSAAVITIAQCDARPRALDLLRWTGQGSILAGETELARHRDRHFAWQVASDGQLAIEGLVRGTVEFVGSTNDAASNQLRRWQAPLAHDQPPGINRDIATPPLVY